MTNCSLQSHRHKACAQSGCGLRPCSPHSPSRPTRATQSYSRKRLIILKMAIKSSKMATGSPCRVFQKHPCFWKLATHCHSGRRPGSRRVKASLYAVLNECRLLGLLTPSTNISRRLAISLRPSARLILSKTAPLHWFSKNETLIYNCQFFDNLPTVNFIYQNYAQTVSKSLSGFARLGFKKQSSLRIDSDVI